MKKIITPDNTKSLLSIIESYQVENIRLLNAVRDLELNLQKERERNRALRKEMARVIKNTENRKIIFLLISLSGIAVTFRYLADEVQQSIWSSIVTLAILIIILGFSALFLGFINNQDFGNIVKSVLDFLKPTVKRGNEVDKNLSKEDSTAKD